LRDAPRGVAQRPMLRSAAAHHGDIVRRPAAIGHAGALAAGSLRRAPEVDLVELVEAIGGAALVAEQAVALAGGGHGRHRAEPRGNVTLHLGVERPLHPLVGAVRVLGIGREHGRVGPARGAFDRHDARDRLLVGLQRVDLERP